MNADGIIATLQEALAKHDWPEYPVVGGTVTARCHCGAEVRTVSAWLEHLKADVVPEAIRGRSKPSDVGFLNQFSCLRTVRSDFIGP
jgi:hypothetical protein